MTLSVIIPALNEAETLPHLLAPLRAGGVSEILVMDGGSHDGTPDIARKFGATCLPSTRGRAEQLNRGAAAAAGDWLWFLHADTVLPPDWQEQLRRAMEDPAVVGGGFRSVMDAPGAGYRFLDAWGRLRTRIQRSFYGDQGIFVRRDLFERLGGFAEIPAFEDAELSGRMWRAGRAAILPGPIRTSARRWQRNGWWRTVAEHAILALRYELRKDQQRLPTYAPLAPAPSVHLVVVTKAPIPGRVKTRLIPPLSAAEAAQVARALLEDTLRRVGRIPHTRLVVAVEPPEAVPFLRGIAPGAEVVPQTIGNLGARMSAIVADRFDRGASAVILIGSDHPTLGRSDIAHAIRWLRQGGDQLVIGPAEDGGYYLIGLTRPHPELFSRISWSSPAVLQETLARARDAGLQIRRIPAHRDVDTIEDLVRLQQRLSGDHGAAPATARWLQRHRIPSESRSAKDAAQAYHRLAPRYDRRWGRYLDQTLGRAAERIEQACQADRAGRDLRLLDVGCGTGELIRRLTGRIPKIFCTGVDPAWGMLQQATAKLDAIPPQAAFLQGCAERLPFRDGSFDWVVSCNNLHCFQDAAAGVQEMSRVLRPGGRILLLDWCADTPVCRLLNRWCRWFDPTHVWMYGSQQMRRMLCAMGLVVTCGERFRLPLLGRFFGWEMALFVALKLERPSAFRSRTDQGP